MAFPHFRAILNFLDCVERMFFERGVFFAKFADSHFKRTKIKRVFVFVFGQVKFRF
jgi:hypothetical protein